MLLHKEPLISIAFGDARQQFFVAQAAQEAREKHLMNCEPFNAVTHALGIEHLVFLSQVHGIDGIALATPEQGATITSFSQAGDFLLTSIANTGIGVATADCLPIIIHDPFNNVVGIVHAGWRGSIAGVACAAVERMHLIFGTKPHQLRVFFGPSAKVCCYKVGDEVCTALESVSYGFDAVRKINGSFMLDVPLLNQLQLQEVGVLKASFVSSYNKCTICTKSFCSYRREGLSAGRQMTVVALRG